MQVFRTEIRVGLLILVSFALLLVGIFLVSDVRSLWEKKKTIVLLFPYADGVTKGSPVWYAGLAVGEVSNIRIANDVADRIAITVKIDPAARVRKDSNVSIRNLGMMGSKYVEITPGSPGSGELESGDTLEGQSPASISEIIETARTVAVRVDDLVKETHALVQEVRGESAIPNALQNAGALLMDLRERGKELAPIVKRLSSFTDSLDATGKNLKNTSGEGGKELTSLLRELRDTNRGLQTRLTNVEARLSETLAQVGKGFTEARGVVSDVRSLVVSTEEDIASIFRNLNETTKNLEGLSDDLKSHPWKIVWKGQGPSGSFSSTGTDKWREKGRIGPHGKE